MRRRISSVLGLLVLASSLAACGSGSDRAQRLALMALHTRLPSSQSSSPSGPASCEASLRPAGPLPPPGAMPAGTYMWQIQRRGYLLAGVDQNTYRLSYLDPHGTEPIGFEIDMLHQLAKAIFGNPNKIRFVALTTDERIGAIQKGNVDVVADAFTITCKRKHEVDFSTVYFDAAQSLLVPSNSSIRSTADLAGRKVCVTRTSTSLQTLETLAPHALPYKVGSRIDCLVALQQGQVDAITSDDAILLGFKAQDPNTKILPTSLAPEPYGIAISRQHPQFVRFVNGVLAKLRSDGTWALLYRKWLAPYSHSWTPHPPQPSYTH